MGRLKVTLAWGRTSSVSTACVCVVDIPLLTHVRRVSFLVDLFWPNLAIGACVSRDSAIPTARFSTLSNLPFLALCQALKNVMAKTTFTSSTGYVDV